ncbi:hypothetical protein ACHAXS_005232 [Conticribra weissflogii]
MHIITIYFALAFLNANSAFGFMQPSRTHTNFIENAKPPLSPCFVLHSHFPTPRLITALHQSEIPETDDGETAAEDEYEEVEFFVTPEQITSLRKEAAKRERRKALPKFFVPIEESAGDCSEETMEGILELFGISELIEVRGVSKDEKKRVYEVAHELAATLEDEMGKPVVIVDIKGFAVKMYSPWFEDEGDSSRIQLYSSYRPNQWTRKPKPIRDERGQIVIGEDGKSVKVVPE